MAIWQRRREGADLTGLIHHSDRGAPYRAIGYGQALCEADALASVGSKGDSYDNALAEALNSLYKAELIRNRDWLDEHGPWKGIDDVELATAEWVHWYNTTRPHTSIDMHTPIEHEQAWTPPPDTDTENTHDQTTSQPQPATTRTR